MKIFYTYFFISFTFTILFSGCESSKPMKISSIQRLDLSEIPSASGIEFVNGYYWIIGDNSPYLFRLDQKFELIDKMVLGSLDDAVHGVIPKLKKLDLEAMLSMKWKKDSVFFVFGSGSKLPERAFAWKINIKNPALQEKIDLTVFYDLVMNETKLKENDFNIEAAVELNGKIYLFNRGRNKLISMRSAQFIEFIEGDRKELKLKSYNIDLPKIGGIEAGFSGATADEKNNRIIFTASVENTTDWVADGEVLGSLIGLIDVDDIENHYEPSTVLITEINGDAIRFKVESIALKNRSQQSYNCVLVTDSDGGKSELVELTLNF